MKQSLLKFIALLSAFSIGIAVFEIYNCTEIAETKVEVQNVAPIFVQENEISKGQLAVIENNIEESISNNESAEEKNFSAWYALDDFKYKKMPEVDMIYFDETDLDENGDVMKNSSYSSGIYTSLSDDIDEGFAEGIQTTVKDNTLKFQTKKLKGIEYRFQGTFFKNKMIGEQNEKVLRGTLQKFVKGKKVAEVSGDFEYLEPYCLH